MEKIIIKIKRQKSKTQLSYYQYFEYSGDMNIPVTTLLERINNQKNIKDIDGNVVDPIEFSCSCLQGLCGSCAMVINDIPQLACKAFLNKVVKNNQITIQPLTKFIVKHDLKVDRTYIYDMMKETQQWVNDEVNVNQKNIPFEYEMSQCLMCGCCIEVCPNHILDDKYIGIPAVVSSAKLINQEKDEKHIKEIKYHYKKKFYSNCVKSFLCQNVCPMNIPTKRAISTMNKHSVWWFWHFIK